MSHQHRLSDLNSVITPLLQFAHVLTERVDRLLVSSLGLGVSQYRVLEVIHQLPRCTQKSIATTLTQTEASISRQLTLLKQQGLITVHKRVEDARARSVILTPRGSQVRTSANEILRQLEQDMVADCTDGSLSGCVQLLTNISLQLAAANDR